MLQSILCHSLQAVELLLAVLDYRLLGVETLANGIELVALTLVLALLLIELNLALLHLRLGRLDFLQALVGLAFSIVLDFYAFLTAFEELLLTDYLGLAVSFVDYSLGPAARHGLLHSHGGQRANGEGHNGYCKINDYIHDYYFIVF